MLNLPHRVSRMILQQFNEAVDKYCQRTVTEIKNKIKRLKADYHQERRRRNQSGAGGGSNCLFFDEMDDILGARPISSGGDSFSSIPPRNEETDLQNGRLHWYHDMYDAHWPRIYDVRCWLSGWGCASYTRSVNSNDGIHALMSNYYCLLIWNWAPIRHAIGNWC